MQEYILALYNETYFRDAKDTYEELPESLQRYVRHWQAGYVFLGGGDGRTASSSRQIASLLFLFWETREESDVR